MFERVRRSAQARGQLLLLAGGARQARAWGAAGAHGWAAGRGGTGIRTLSVHGAAEAVHARWLRPDAIFVSPVWPTRSHRGAPALGTLRFALLARSAGIRALALGGVDPLRALSLPRIARGWAAIDHWSGRRRPGC